MFILHGATLFADEDGLLQVWGTQVLGIWCDGARELLEGLLAKVVLLPVVFLVRRRVFLGKEVLPMRWVALGLLDLLAVISRMCLVMSPPTGKVVGLREVGKVELTLVLVSVGNFYQMLGGGSGR